MKNLIENAAYSLIGDILLRSNPTGQPITFEKFYNIHAAVTAQLSDLLRDAFEKFFSEHRDDFYSGPPPIPYSLLSDIIDNELSY